jgi:hypothetical protein
MDELLFAKQKLAQIKAEISRVRTSDFHHPGAKRVLDTIEHAIFDHILAKVEHVSPSTSINYLNELRFTANIYIAHFHQIIGIVLRSTNARNSFEVYDPLLRLAKKLLGNDTVLILSSEWDYIPFTMPSVFGGVPNCTVVGLPVMEAANALLTPLAGHELGHGVWRSRELGDETEQDRRNALCDIFLENWSGFKKHTCVENEAEMRSRLERKEWDTLPLNLVEGPLSVMGKVCEELFCDALGIRLFGMGYRYAFEYLAAPSLGETELQEYPAFDARARYLADAISEIGGLDAGGDAGECTGSPKPAKNKRPWPRLDGYGSRFKRGCATP